MNATTSPNLPHTRAGWFAALAALTATLLPLAVAVSASATAGAKTVAAVFPPWWSATDTYRAAASAGPVLSLGAVEFIAVVAAADPTSRAALRQAGAWLFIGSDDGAAGCRPKRAER